VTDEVLSAKSTTRRNVIKLGAAAALAAAGTAALGATKTHAAGSGDTIDIFFPPERVANTIGHAQLTNGHEVVLGTFPAGTSGFSSDSYYGMFGNLTATRYVAAGWLSVRPNGAAFTAASIVVNYSGTGRYWSNFFIVRFGDPVPLSGLASDGKIIVRCGGGATNFIVDLVGFLGPDQ
jgi:hypothetical protein